jgi:acid phosphatase type 7
LFFPELPLTAAEYDYTGGQEHDPSKQREPGGGSFVPEWWNNGATASRGECGVPMFYRFAAPSNGNSIFWYAFYYGNVFVVQLSSEHNFTRGSNQWNWLQQTLARVDRARAPWVIVTMHRPIYSTQMCETGDYVVSLHMRQALDPLFEQYNVNLVLVAHTHSYERTCPLLGGECVEDGRGVVHMTVGSAGAGLETCGYSPAFGNFSRSHINTWGYLRAATTDDVISLQFLLDVDGSIFDEYTLRRSK